MLVPVIDLRLRFDADEAPCTPTTVTIVVYVTDGAGGQRPLGLVVDAVSDVLEANPEQIKVPPSFGTEVDTRFMESMITVGDRMVLVLRIDGLLDGTELEELAVLDEVSLGGEPQGIGV